MGLELLDIRFRPEKRFEIHFGQTEFNDVFARRRPRDATAGELAALVRAKVESSAVRPENVGEPAETGVFCMTCGCRERAGRRAVRFCPECGAKVEMDAWVWRACGRC